MVMGLGTGDWGDKFPLGNSDPEPRHIQCLRCGKTIDTLGRIDEHIGMDFVESDNGIHWGAVCTNGCEGEKNGR